MSDNNTNTSSQQPDYTTKHNTIRNDILNTHTDNTWQFHSTLQDVTIYTKTVDGSNMAASKGIGVIQYEPHIVDALLKCTRYASLLDDLYDTSTHYSIEYSTDQISEIVYQTSKTPSSFVAPRDTLYHSETLYNSGNSIISTSYSIDYNEHKQLNNKYVRAILLYAGILLQPYTDTVTNKQYTKITIITAVNPGGAIPGFLLNTAITQQPLLIARIQKLISTNTSVLQGVTEYAIELQQRRAGAYVEKSAMAADLDSNATYNNNVPTDYITALDKAQQLALSALLLRTTDSNEWIHIGIDSNIDVHTKNIPNTIYCRGLYYINDFTLNEVIALYTDYNVRQQWDFMCATASQIYSYNNNCMVGYMRFQPPPWPLSPRDSCIIVRLIQFDHNTTLFDTLDKTIYGDGNGYLLVATSIDHEQCTQNKSYVRATIDYTMLYLRKFSNSNKIGVVTASSTNPSGSMSLPTKLIQGISAKSPLILLAMHTYMQKHRNDVQQAVQRFNKLHNTVDTDISAATNDDKLYNEENDLLRHITTTSKSIEHNWSHTLPYDIQTYNSITTLQRMKRAYNALQSQQTTQCGMLYIRILQYTIPNNILKQNKNNVLIRISLISTTSTLTPIAEYQTTLEKPTQSNTIQHTIQLTSEQRETSHLVCPIRDITANIQIDVYINDLQSPYTTHNITMNSLLSNQHTQFSTIQQYDNVATHSHIVLHTYTNISRILLHTNNILHSISSTYTMQHNNAATHFITDMQRLCCMWLVLAIIQPLYMILLWLPLLIHIFAPQYNIYGSLILPFTVVLLSYSHINQYNVRSTVK